MPRRIDVLKLAAANYVLTHQLISSSNQHQTLNVQLCFLTEPDVRGRFYNISHIEGRVRIRVSVSS